MAEFDYDIGDVATLSATFTNAAGTATDPDTVTVTVREPDGTLEVYVYGTDPEVVKDATGRYSFDQECTVAGTWFYSFVGTGAVATAEEGTFSVRPTSVDAGGPGRTLCDLADVVRFVPGFDPTDAATQRILLELILSESADAMDLAGREVVAIAPALSPRDFDVTRWVVRNRRVKVGDMTTVSSVTLLDTDRTTTVATIATTDRTSLPLVRQEWEPIREVRLELRGPSPAALAVGQVVRVAGTWGFPAIPPNLRMAVAKMVLVRYLEDAAEDGTPLAEALAEVGFNAGRAFVSARETIRRFGRKPMVA